MNEIEILTRQTRDTYDWCNRIFDSIPQDLWDEFPDTIKSTVTWQMGHLIVSIYYHSIMVIKGHNKTILEKIPMKKYSDYFTSFTDPADSIGIFSPDRIKHDFLLTQEVSLKTIGSLKSADLYNNLEPTKTKHPIAKKKLDALDWNIKHIFWHLGQVAILKRIVDERFDFGLERSDS